MTRPEVVIFGAGPAGLSAAWRLTSEKVPVTLLEKESVVGGISRTETHNGYRFDLGGHRFLTRIPEVKRLWFEAMGSDFIEVKRKSRILYNGRYLHYPLHLQNLLASLGLKEGLLCLGSYLKSHFLPQGDPDTLEGWVVNRFGERLFAHFFKSYSEKVWGRPCSGIRSHWSAQRIRTLSFSKALSDALVQSAGVKSLVRRFYYPVKGAGMMWDRLRYKVETGGGYLRIGSHLVRLACSRNRIDGVFFEQAGEKCDILADQFISTIPLTNLIGLFDPPAPERVLDACRSLAFRSMVLVLLIVNRETVFPDQWIYVQDDRFRVGRLQNFKQWSPQMVPDPGTTSVGMEYFCDPFDRFYSLDDAVLIHFASKEIEDLNLAKRSQILDAAVRRVPFAYPVYDMDYERHLRTVRTFLDRFENLHTIGRNGMHAYNNMDLAMQSGLLAADNIMGANHDLWQLVEDDKNYLE